MNQRNTIVDEALIFALKDFSNTQEKLIWEFQKKYHLLDNKTGYLKSPKTGLLSAIDEEWKFQKHGIGICFENIKSGKTIDAHNGIGTSKKFFDAWRLMQYFESVGIDIIIWKSKSYYTENDDELDKLLEILSKNNIIKQISNKHKLYELIEV